MIIVHQDNVSAFAGGHSEWWLPQQRLASRIAVMTAILAPAPTPPQATPGWRVSAREREFLRRLGQPRPLAPRADQHEAPVASMPAPAAVQEMLEEARQARPHQVPAALPQAPLAALEVDLNTLESERQALGELLTQAETFVQTQQQAQQRQEQLFLVMMVLLAVGE